MTNFMRTRMRAAAWLACAATLSSAVGAGSAWADDGDDDRSSRSVVSVSCPWQSINEALARAPVKRPILIRVFGACHENVTIRRNNVTIRGIGASSSKIIGVLESDLIEESPLTIEASTGIVVEKLTIAGGTSSGIGTTASSIRLRECVVENNGFNGVGLAGGGLVTIDDCDIRHNAHSGVRAQGGGVITVTNSDIESNDHHGVSSSSGSRVLVGSDIVGERGRVTVTGNGREAVIASNGGTVELVGAEVESSGPIGVFAIRSSTVVMTDSNVSATGNSACAAFISDGSALRVNGGTSLTNNAPGFNCPTLSVYRNSTARLRGSGNTITNQVPVDGGADSSAAGGFALDTELVSSLRIDGTGPAVVNGNVESFNLSTVDLRRVVLNGGAYADGLNTNIRLRGNIANDVIVNGDVFPGGDSPMNIRNGGEVVINGNIDCSNGANVRSNFSHFGPGGDYVNCPF